MRGGTPRAVRQLGNGRAAPPSQQTGATTAQGEVPRIENAELETRTVSASLDATLREIVNATEKSEWVGYRVDQVAGNREACCNSNWNDGNCGTCQLEKESGGTAHATRRDAKVKLEAGRQPLRR